MHSHAQPASKPSFETIYYILPLQIHREYVQTNRKGLRYSPSPFVYHANYSTAKHPEKGLFCEVTSHITRIDMFLFQVLH